jgi:hypothetical protein
MLRRFLLGLILALPFYGVALAAPITSVGTPDPCSSVSLKNSVAINQSSATTTQLVASSSTTTIFVCHFDMTIAASATTAASAKLEYGTGSSCATPTALTGAYGSNDAAVSTTPTFVEAGDGGYTVVQVPSGSSLCIVTAGNAVLTQGLLVYVQQNLFLPQ